MMVVVSLVTTTRRACPSTSSPAWSSLRPDLLGDDLTAGEDGHVLQHRLAAVAEPGRLDRDDREGAADLVDDERGEASPSTSSAMTSSGLPVCTTFSSTGSRSWIEEILPWLMRM
jgi:hypothetical protein